MAVNNNLRGRLALITGASGGIGAACARQLVLHDVDLALSYSTNRLAVDELVAQLRKDHDCERPDAGYLRISTHQADLASADETVKLCEDVRKAHGKHVDILIANAGHGKRIRDIWDIPLEDFEHTINVNLRAPFLLAKGVVEGMKSQSWGRIIFVSSIAAYGAGVNGAHYAASKGGMTGMMKNLSTRLVEYGITVNDVSPAMIGNTGMIPSIESVSGQTELPMGRLGVPEEVANVVLMYCQTGYATGQSFVLAGGINHK
ncbi:NAD(P)-binding protein [Aulographum hederae CBS 113979]|uniref:NAD(P)-binding protein n=1 Tax=Aulographum hederae CBS 113979 TaxID=1176131 RepID=A0A6G1H726_9PEZI|nr:NAD(P)-binding protein [Aulographum hederae CBS 113979]